MAESETLLRANLLKTWRRVLRRVGGEWRRQSLQAIEIIGGELAESGGDWRRRRHL
jgi:hypothetical protein